MQEQPDGGRPRALWVDYVETIIRRRRLVIACVGVAWACLVAWFLLAPVRYRCEATLSIPPVPPVPVASPPPSPALERPGITFETYKKLERFISDGAVLRRAFGQVLGPSEIEASRLLVGVSPIASGSRDDIGRSLPTDTVVAVRLWYDASQSDRAEKVVFALADLVRLGRMHVVTLDRFEADLVRAVQTAGSARAKISRLGIADASLRTMEKDLLRVAALSPSGQDRVREVVDIADGGHRYLPVAAQLVGLRAQIAQNAHDVRIAESEAWVASRRAAILSDILAEIRAEPAKEPHALLQSALVAASRDPQPEARLLEAELALLREPLLIEKDATRFIQQPTIQQPHRMGNLLKSLILSAVLSIGVAWLAEAWSRAHR